MNKKPIRVAVTGAAGNISYSLLFRIASGQMFGADQPIHLQLLEIDPALEALKGVIMELEDCAFPLLKQIDYSSNPEEAFKEVEWALLVGSMPRKQGMERSELLSKNGKIFIEQGKALQKSAASSVRILVVGNPCNTNCAIAKKSAPDIPADRWFAMTRLDENRAKAQLAQKAGVDITEVSNLCVWGNHSPTMFPDFYNARIKGEKATGVITDESWLKENFVPRVAKRGAEIIEARGASSAASAANAVIDTVVSLREGTPAQDFTSVAVCSDGSYGIEEGLIASMPIRSDGKKWEVVQGLPITDYAREKIDASITELQQERDTVNNAL